MASQTSPRRRSAGPRRPAPTRLSDRVTSVAAFELELITPNKTTTASGSVRVEDWPPIQTPTVRRRPSESPTGGAPLLPPPPPDDDSLISPRTASPSSPCTPRTPRTPPSLGQPRPPPSRREIGEEIERQLEARFPSISPARARDQPPPADRPPEPPEPDEHMKSEPPGDEEWESEREPEPDQGPGSEPQQDGSPPSPPSPASRPPSSTSRVGSASRGRKKKRVIIVSSSPGQRPMTRAQLRRMERQRALKRNDAI